MKSNKKILGFVALATIMVFLILACSSDNNSSEPTEKYSIGATMTFSDYQVWERNYSVKKLSETHYKFKGNRNMVQGLVNKMIIDEDDDTKYSFEEELIGSGEIKDGYLNLSIPALGNDLLLKEGEDILYFFFREWYYDFNIRDYTDISITPPETRGNMVDFKITDNNDDLIRENLSGTKTSLSGEFIHYIYVDRSCTIRAGELIQPFSASFAGIEPGTYVAFNLSLKEGWNALCNKQTHTTTEQSSYSWEVKHPDHKWVIVATGKTLDDFKDIDP